MKGAIVYDEMWVEPSGEIYFAFPLSQRFPDEIYVWTPHGRLELKQVVAFKGQRFFRLSRLVQEADLTPDLALVSLLVKASRREGL